jgi:hypothetical protein
MGSRSVVGKPISLRTRCGAFTLPANQPEKLFANVESELSLWVPNPKVKSVHNDLTIRISLGSFPLFSAASSAS